MGGSSGAEDITTLLNKQKGKPLMIKLRSGKIVRGVLRDFDVHMTMELDSVTETPAPGDTAAADDAAPADGKPIDSVLLRGDNILMVSIPDDDTGEK